MLRGRCLWGPDFFSWWCWTHLHMNWIKTSLIRPGEHAFLPIALVSNTLPPSAYLRVHCLLFFFFFSFFYTPFPQCSAFTFARLLWGGFFFPLIFFFSWPMQPFCVWTSALILGEGCGINAVVFAGVLPATDEHGAWCWHLRVQAVSCWSESLSHGFLPAAL